MSEYKPVDLITPVGVLSFPNLWTPRGVQGGEPRYSLALIFTPDQLSDPRYVAMKEEVAKCARDTFGAQVNFQGLRLPFRSVSEKAQYANFDQNSMFISAWSKQKPKVITAQKMAVDIPDDVWAGQTARIIVRPFAYNTSGNRGVSFGLGHVQMADMTKDRLDGRKSAEDSFDELTDYLPGGSNQGTVADLPF